MPDENICKRIASVHVFVILKGAHFYMLTTSELVILMAFEKSTFKTKLYNIIFIYRHFLTIFIHDGNGGFYLYPLGYPGTRLVLN